MKEHTIHEPAPQGATVRSNYFPALTGIRAVAASMVFLHHFNPFNPVHFGDFVHDFVGEFHTGVTIFFVLSGFLICYRYYDAISFSRKWIWNYFINRFARIYPMYFLFTVIAFLPFVCHCVFREQLPVFALNISFLRGFFDEYKFTGVKTGWSLTVEEVFYALFPLIVLASGRIRLWLQPVLILATGLLLWLIFRNVSFHGFFSSLRFLYEFTFFGRCVEFYAGIYLALVFRKKGLTFPAGKRFPVRTVVGISWIVICIGLLVINRWYAAKDGTFLFFETAINNFTLPIGIVFLFSGLMTERSFVRGTLQTKVFDLLGKASYIFYLIHNGFLFELFYVRWRLPLPVIFLLMHGVSLLLYLIAERPLNKLIRRRLQA